MKSKIDSKLFWAVKTMLQGGASTEEIVNYFSVSACSVTRIRKSESYEEYKQILAAVNTAIKKKNAEKATEEPVKAPPAPAGTMNQMYIQNRVYELLKEQNELLKLISNKLVFIVEQLS